MKFKFLPFLVLTFAVIAKVSSQSCYLSNSKHTGCYEGSIRDNPSLTWKFKTNGRIFSSPVIYKSIIIIGSNDSCLYAINKNNGVLVWKFKTKGTVNSSAAVSNNVVYINSSDGYLYALNMENGKLIWKYNMGGEKIFQALNMHGIKTDGKVVEDPWDMYLSSPVVSKNMVYIGNGNGNLFAIYTKNGQLAWKFKTNGVIHSSPAFSGDSIYFASWDSYIYGLNATTGKEYWRFKTGIDTVNYNQVGFQSSAAILGNMLYIGSRDAKMRAINRFTGNLEWDFSTEGSWIIGAPAIYNNRVYFGTSDTYRLLSLDTNSGKVVFDKLAKSYVFSSPAIAGDKLYVGTFGGFLYKMDCNTGKTQSIFRTAASVDNGQFYLNNDSTINGSKVFESSTWEGMLQALNHLYSMGSIMSSPAISDNKIYFGSTDGYVYALE